MPLTTAPVGILVGAPHPNASRLFLDFILSQEGQELMNTKLYGMYSMRADVPPPAGQKQLAEHKSAAAGGHGQLLAGEPGLSEAFRGPVPLILRPGILRPVVRGRRASLRSPSACSFRCSCCRHCWRCCSPDAASGFAPLAQPDIVLNTLVFGVFTTICAVLIGLGLAMALAPQIPGRAMLERLVVMPLYLTPLLTAMGWNWLASPKSGLLNLILHAVLGSWATINVVSPAGAVAVTALATAPLPFLLISDALGGLDPSLLESARVHGARPATVFRRVVLPLLQPAILASALLVCVQAIGMFSVPAVLGMPAGFNVATTQIFQLLENYPPRIGDAIGLGRAAADPVGRADLRAIGDPRPAILRDDHREGISPRGGQATRHCRPCPARLDLHRAGDRAAARLPCSGPRAACSCRQI